MTGATSGFGKVAALHVASKGAKVIVLARNKKKGNELISAFKELSTNNIGNIDVVNGDLTSFDSVIKACNEIKKTYHRIDQIVLNAGIMKFEYSVTENGIEESLQVNLLSHILIIHLLIDLLMKAKKPKLIFTSSGLHQGDIDFGNLEFKHNFSSYKSYRQSKLGVILITRLLAEKLKSGGVKVVCQHPGMVKTGMGNSASWLSKKIFLLMGQSIEKGAENLIYLMNTPYETIKSGEFYKKKMVRTTTNESYDMKTANKLLQVSKSYLKQYIVKPSTVFPS